MPARASSSAIVPCPAITFTSGWSNGCTNVSPSPISSCARSNISVDDEPCRITLPPSASIATTLCGEGRAGMTTTQSARCRRAAYAAAIPAFPELTVTMPRARSAGVMSRTLL